MSTAVNKEAASAAIKKAEEEKVRSRLLGIPNPLSKSGGSGYNTPSNAGTPGAAKNAIPQPPPFEALKKLTDPAITASSISNLKRELLNIAGGKGSSPLPPQAVPVPPPPPIKTARTKAQQQTFDSFLADGENVDVDNMNLSSLDITNIDIDFDALEDYSLVKDALLQGVDLKKYSLQIEEQLADVEKASVADYFASREDFIKLRDQLGHVNSVLGNFEDLLTVFQNDLKSISSEMRSLQNESMSMDIKLKNRKKVSNKLHDFVEEVTVQQDLVAKISKDDINDLEYLKKIIILDKKLSLVQAYKAKNISAVHDAEPQLQRVLAKAVARIQKYLLVNVTHFASLRERRAKQKELSPMGYFFQFLFKHAPQTANELVATYVDSCNTSYTTYYRNYLNAFARMTDEAGYKSEFIGSTSNKIKSFLANKLEKKSVNKSKLSKWALGTRNEILQAMDAPPLDPPVSFSNSSSVQQQTPTTSTPTGPKPTASTPTGSKPATNTHQQPQQQTTNTPLRNSPSAEAVKVGSGSPATDRPVVGTKYPYEVIFRTITYQLMEIISSEHFFVADFFLGGEDVSLAIFKQAIAIFVENVESYLSNTFDAMSLTLMLIILYNYQKTMREKSIKILDRTFQLMYEHTLSRLLRVLEMNLESLKINQLKDLKPIEVAPHYIVRRFADFYVSLAYLSKHANDELRASMSSAVKPIREAMINLMKRMVQEVIENPRDKTAFIIANYGLIIYTAQERELNTREGLMSPFRQYFDKIATRFVDEQLNAHKYFVALINFTNEWAPLVESNIRIDQTANPKFSKDVVENILREFEISWKIAIDDIKKNLKKLFVHSPFAANQILIYLLDTLHLHYQQLIDITLSCFPELKTSKFYRPEQVKNDMRILGST